MLSLKNVSIIDKKNNQPLLNNVSLEVRPGDFVMVSGQNPKEREVLISVLGALETVDSGEIYIDGIEQTKYTTSQMVTLRREKFGYLLEDCYIDEFLTTAQNIALPLTFANTEPKIYQEKLERALNIVGLGNFKNVLVKRLTEWQKNKVLIARAIVNLPQVVILSEPCRVLDKFKMEEVLGLLSALNKDGVTIIINSNQPEYMSVAKRKVVVTNGGILEVKKERKPRDLEPKKTKKTTKSKKDKSAKKETKPIESTIEEPKVEAPIEAEVEKVKQVKPAIKKTDSTPAKKVVAKEKNEESKKIVEPVKIVAEKKTARKTTKKQFGQDSEQLKFELEKQDEIKPIKKTVRKKQGVSDNVDAN